MNPGKSCFSEWLIKHNKLDELGFEQWVFQPGMLFNANEKWWVDNGFRPAPHEGMDFCCFRKQDHTISYLKENVLVPVMYDGEIDRVFDDFLGQSVLVAHDIYSDKARLYSVYAHVFPGNRAMVGDKVKAGDIIASISPGNGNLIPPHLHISVLWVRRPFPERVGWTTITDPEIATLCNPLDFMEFSGTLRDRVRVAYEGR
jgi:hypothetical protein